MVASLFHNDSPAPLKTAHLIAADSPRQAFYTIWIEPAGRFFRVCKISGAGGRVWHRQAWECDSLAAAERLFNRRVREKTNPARRSRRKYRLGSLLPVAEAA